jgi:hypothetical protein
MIADELSALSEELELNELLRIERGDYWSTGLLEHFRIRKISFETSHHKSLKCYIITINGSFVNNTTSNSGYLICSRK